MEDVGLKKTSVRAQRSDKPLVGVAGDPYKGLAAAVIRQAADDALTARGVLRNPKASPVRLEQAEKMLAEARIFFLSDDYDFYAALADLTISSWEAWCKLQTMYPSKLKRFNRKIK